MKVLWLSNSAFVSEKTKATGSWVQPMAEQLATSIKMVNVVDGMVKEPVSCNFRNIKQWIIPAHPTNPVECCADANPKTMLPNDT